MKLRLLGRLLMAAAFLLHVLVALQQGHMFLTEEGLVRAVLDSDGSETENGKLRVHAVTNPETMVLATVAGGGEDGLPPQLVWCTVLRGEARTERVQKYQGTAVLKQVEIGDRYFARFLKMCRTLRGPLAPEFDEVTPSSGESVWVWMSDLFSGILQAVQDFCTWIVKIVRGLVSSGSELGPTIVPLDDLSDGNSDQELSHAKAAGLDRMFGRSNAIASGLKACYTELLKCDHVIAPGEMQDGLYNGADREIFSCGCTSRFSRCIQRLNVPLSAAARQSWHHPEPTCFHHDLENVCTLNLGVFCARWEIKPIAKERVLTTNNR